MGTGGMLDEEGDGATGCEDQTGLSTRIVPPDGYGIYVFFVPGWETPRPAEYPCWIHQKDYEGK